MNLPPLSAAASPFSQTTLGIFLGVLIVLLFHCSLFVGAYYFFATHLYRDYEVQRPSVQHLFCATFTSCVSMLQLLLLELLHILNPHVRRFIWNLDLICVLLLLYVILPVSIIHNIVAPSADSFRVTSWIDKLPDMRRLHTKAAALSRLASVSNLTPSGREGQGFISLLQQLPPRWREWVSVAACSVIALPILWFCFQQSGRLLHLDPEALDCLSYTERLLAYVGVCGVTVVSALAGFGSVNYPYRNIAAFLYPTTQAEVACVEQRLLHTLNLVSEKKKARLFIQASLTPARAYLWPTPTSGILSSSTRVKNNSAASARSARSNSKKRQAFRDAASPGAATTAADEASLTTPSNSSSSSSSSSSNGGSVLDSSSSQQQQQGGERMRGLSVRFIWNYFADMFARVRGYISGCRLEQQCQQLQNEIEALEELSRELFVGLDDLVHSRAQAVYGQTLLGRLNNLVGWFMTFVCVYRVIMSAVNILLDRVNTTDPATRTLEVLLHLLHIPLDIKLLTPYLSLFLLGWIVALTIRGFLEKLLAVFRYMSTAVSSDVFALIMSEVMGVYFSACLLLTRMYLPQAYRAALAQVLAPSLDFHAFHLHFDRVFVLSSLACAISIAVTHKRTAEKLKSL